jgi:hypothetical protein
MTYLKMLCAIPFMIFLVLFSYLVDFGQRNWKPILLGVGLGFLVGWFI